MPKAENPGALQGEQLISLAEPFGGHVSTPAGSSNSYHFLASVEGVEPPISTIGTSNKSLIAGQYAESDGVTLFKSEKYGHIAPGDGFSVVSDATPYINDLPVTGDVESGGTAVILLKNGRVLQLASGGASTNGTIYDPTDQTPISSVNNDMIIFRDFASTPIEYAVWSWEYSGGADIAIVQSNNLSTSHDDDWYSAVVAGTPLVKGNPHKLCVGPDGNIYVTDGPKVYQIVVTAAIASAVPGNTMNVGTGWTITGICSYKNYIAVIASNKVSTFAKGQVRVFLWDGTATTLAGVTSTAPQYVYPIADNFGNGIFYDGNALYAFTNGRNNTSKIFELTSKGFVKVFETPFIVLSTNAIQGSVEAMQDGILIAAQKYTDVGNDHYGHLMRFYAGGFHDDGWISDGDNYTGHVATATGMCANLFQNNWFIGVGYGASYKIYYRNPNTYQCSTATSGSTIDLRSILYTSGILGRRMYPMGFKMTVSRIKIFFSQWGTGASLYLSAFKGYDTFLPGNSLTANGGVDLLNILIDTNSAIANGFISGTNPGGYSTGYYHYCLTAGSYEVDLSDIGIIDVSSFYMNIRWKHTTPGAVAAIIRRAEFHVAQSQ